MLMDTRALQRQVETILRETDLSELGKVKKNNTTVDILFLKWVFLQIIFETAFCRQSAGLQLLADELIIHLRENDSLLTEDADIATLIARCFALRAVNNYHFLEYLKRDERQLAERVLLNIGADYITNGDNIDNVLVCMYMAYCTEHGIKACFDKQIKRLSEDTSNISFEKYRQLPKKLYSRKIHGSYHFATPLFFIYWVNRFLKSADVKIKNKFNNVSRFISQCVENINQLDMQELVWLFMILPGNTLIKEKIMQDAPLMLEEKWQPPVFYFTPVWMQGRMAYSFFQEKRILWAALLNGLNRNDSSIPEFYPPASGPENKADSEFELRFLKYKILIHMNKRIEITMRNECMYPVLKDGDRLIVQQKPKYEINDIVVFKYYRNKIMAHKIMDIVYSEDDKQILITVAENGLMWGYPVFSDEVIGKVVSVNSKLWNERS